jgi:hypothetical protein
MESALIAASTILESFEQGRFDAAFLSRFEPGDLVMKSLSIAILLFGKHD